MNFSGFLRDFFGNTDNSPSGKEKNEKTVKNSPSLLQSDAEYGIMEKTNICERGISL